MDQQTSIQNNIALAPYGEAFSRFLSMKLKQKKVTYPQLANLLEQKGIVLTPGNLRNKVSNRLMPTSLFLIIIDVLNVKGDVVSEILTMAKELEQEL